MRFLTKLVSLLLGVALVVLIFWAVAPFGRENTHAAKNSASFETPVAQPKPGAPPAASPETTGAAENDAHAVDPATGAPKPHLLAREQAEAARFAAIEAKSKEQKDAGPAKLYYRVKVRDGGTLEVLGLVITLDGILAREASATCEDADDQPWDCGAQARAALAHLIRSRAVVCALPEGGETQAFTTRCRVGSVDLSTWMVRQGWAEPKQPPAPELAEAEKAAKSDHIGLWQGPE
jgi:endonuclease YncB( thermonuclease family)